MSNDAVQQKSSSALWSSTQVYAMAVVCLVVGLAVGYLFRGSQSPAPANRLQENAAGTASPPGMGHMPSLEQMKHMADVQAQPLLEKLKTDPNNSDLLFQVGNVYKATHQFKEAQGYYERASKANPNNIGMRTELASSLYYNGDVEGAIAQLQQSLKQNPTDANSLFNLGVIKWEGKQDASGALAAWQELLKSNPKLSPDRKATVQRMIANVKQQTKPTQLQDVSR